MRARDVKESGALPLMWGDPDVMAYKKLGAQHLDARGFGALPGHVRASKIVFAKDTVLRCTEPGVCAKKSGGL